MVGVFIALILFTASILLLLLYISPKIKSIERGKRDIIEFIPIQNIDDDGIIYGENAEITVGVKLMLPEVYLLSEKEINELQQDWVSLMKSLPEGTKIQKQDFYYVKEYRNEKDFNYLLDKKNTEHYLGRPVLNSYSLVYFTFPKETNGKKVDVLTRRFKTPVRGNLGGIEKRVEEVNKTMQGIIQRINGFKGYKAKRMDGKEVLNEIYKYITQKYDEEISVEKLPEIEVTKEGYLKVGQRLLGVISLMEEGGFVEPAINPKTSPGENYKEGVSYQNKIKSKTGYAFPIHGGLPVKHCVNTIINIIGNETLINELRSEKNSLNFLATFYEPARIKQRVIEGFIQDVLEQGFTGSSMTVNVIVDAKDINELDEKCNAVETAFLNMNQSKGYRESYELGGIYFESIPGHSIRGKREIRNVTAQAACYINNEGMYVDDNDGVVFLDRYGKPVVVELWNSKYTNNRNKLIFGPSGSGKSYFINGLVSQTYMKGNHVIILEIGRSTKRNCELHNGLYFDTGNRDNLRFNIFKCETDSLGRYVYRNLEDKEEQDDKVNFITTVITAIWKGNKEVSNLEKELVKKSIVRYYEHVNRSESKEINVKGYYKYLDTFKKEMTPRELQILDIEGLKIMLEKYVSGPYQEVLNGEKEIDIENDRFIVFEMEGVQNDPELFTVVSVIIIEMVLQKIKKLKGVRKSLVIDEALNFLQDPKMGDFIGYLYRTIRKKEGEVYIAAQNVKFLDGIAPVVRDSIIINSDTKILLDHSTAKSTYSDLRRILSLNEEQIELLDSLVSGEGFREFLIVLGNRTGIYRMEVSKFADAVFTSKESETREIEKLFEETGSLTTAINLYVEKKAKQYEKK